MSNQFLFTEPTSFIVISTVPHYITLFYNNEYTIISGLTSERTDMGVCFFKNMRSIKFISLRKEIVLRVFP